MKSLSPNAQEFVPFSIIQAQPQQPIHTYLVDPQTGATSPIVHFTYGYVPNNYAFTKPASGQPQSAPPTASADNQYSFYPNQTMPLQILMPQQIPQAAYSPQYSYPPYTISTMPSPPMTAPYPMVYHQPPVTQHQYNNNNKLVKNRKNNFRQQVKQFTKSFEVNEKEWPSLTNGEANNSEINEVKPVEPPEPKVPYIADEAKFRKVVKNVNLIKQTIEQHYLYETNQQSQSKLSFRDAILTKPVKFLNSVKELALTSENKQQQKPNVESAEEEKTEKIKPKKANAREARARLKLLKAEIPLRLHLRKYLKILTCQKRIFLT